jgi:hypothetical protein
MNLVIVKVAPGWFLICIIIEKKWNPDGLKRK